MRKALLAVSVAAFLAAAAQAQPVAVPNANATVAGGGGLNTLTRNAANPRTYQMQVAASELVTIPVGSVITGIRWRLQPSAANATSWPTAADGPATWANYDISLAQATNPISGMSTTFAANMTNPVAVHLGSLTMPVDFFPGGAVLPAVNAWSGLVTFTTPYTYLGGDLVIFVSHTGSSLATSNRFLDVINVGGPGYGTTCRAFSATTFNAPTGAQAAFSVGELTWTSGGGPTPPYGIGSATPNPILIGEDTLLTVTANAGTNPPSTGITVTGNLSTLGGSASQTFYDDGSNGDVTAGDSVFSFLYDGTGGEIPGNYAIAFTVADEQSRSTNGSIALTITPPPPSNDACAGATVVGDGTHLWTLESATNDGTASCGLSATNPDVWFSYTPTQSGTVDANTCGQSTFDTVLTVFDSCGGFELVCNDDNCGVQSRVSFEAVANTTYLIRVAQYNAGRNGTGSLTIGLLAPIPNDNCADAMAVGEGSYPFNNNGGTVDGGDICNGTGPALWYMYTATQAGCAVIETCGSTIDTTLSYFADCLTFLGCNDDFCALQSSLTIPNVTIGQQILVRVAGYAGAVGAGTLTIRVDPQVAYNNPGGTAEGEDCLTDGMTDTVNGGCNSTPNVFGSISCGETISGVSSGYTNATGGASRDTDWFQFTVASDDTVTVSGQAQFIARFGLVALNPCGTAFVTSAINTTCDPSVTVSAFLPAGEYAVWVGPNAFGPAAAVCNINSEYWVSLSFSAGCGASCDPDVNCDGVPDQDDVACMILAVAGDMTCFCQADPDFNGDGVPDQGDVADVILTVAGAPCP